MDKIDELADSSENDSIYEVESVVNHKMYRGTTKFLVKWVGYNEDANTWEPIANLAGGATDLLSEYCARAGLDPATGRALPKTPAAAASALRPSRATSSSSKPKPSSVSASQSRSSRSSAAAKAPATVPTPKLVAKGKAKKVPTPEKHDPRSDKPSTPPRLVSPPPVSPRPGSVTPTPATTNGNANTGTAPPPPPPPPPPLATVTATATAAKRNGSRTGGRWPASLPLVEPDHANVTEIDDDGMLVLGRLAPGAESNPDLVRCVERGVEFVEQEVDGMDVDDLSDVDDGADGDDELNRAGSEPPSPRMSARAAAGAAAASAAPQLKEANGKRRRTSSRGKAPAVEDAPPVYISDMYIRDRTDADMAPDEYVFVRVFEGETEVLDAPIKDARVHYVQHILNFLLDRLKTTPADDDNNQQDENGNGDAEDDDAMDVADD